MATQIQLRRGTAAAWTSANPVLAVGEVGVETDTTKHKIGDGATAWTSLAYATTVPAAHAASHVGADAIQSATSGQDGLATSGQITKLDAIEPAADATDAANVEAAGAVMDSDISETEGFLRKTGVGTYVAVKSNLGAAVAPTVNEDSGDGYGVGSVWIDTTADKVYQCVDATLAAAVWKELSLGSGGGTEEKFYPPIGASTYNGDYAVKSVSSNGTGQFDVHMPQDFASLVSMILVGIPSAGASGSGKDIDLFSSYGAIGESKTQHTESDTTTTYDLTGKTDILWSLDISGVFSSLTASDYGGLQVDHNTIGGAIDYIGLHMIYNKS